MKKPIVILVSLMFALFLSSAISQNHVERNLCKTDIVREKAVIKVPADFNKRKQLQKQEPRVNFEKGSFERIKMEPPRQKKNLK